jgi:hypothetical protein
MRPPCEQEEDQDEQSQDQSRRKMTGGAAEGQRAAEDAAAVVLQRGRGLLDVLVDLRRGQVQRALRQPVLNLLDTGQRLAPQLLETEGQLPAHQGEGTGDEPDEAQDRDGDGGPVGDARLPQPPHHGAQQAGQQRSHHDGNDEEADLGQQPDQGAGDQQDQAQPPGPCRRNAHPVGNVLFKVTVRPDAPRLQAPEGPGSGWSARPARGTATARRAGTACYSATRVGCVVWCGVLCWRHSPILP